MKIDAIVLFVGIVAFVVLGFAAYFYAVGSRDG